MILLLAQVMLVATPEPLPASPPSAAPIERRQLRETPEFLFAAVVSGDDAQRRDALDALGFEWMRGAHSGEAALLATSFDSDSEPERLLTLPNAAALLKREGGVWWLLGSFSCCGPTGTAAEPFAEWKELVWPGIKDLIIHSGGAQGPGVGRHLWTAYRVWRGRLYPVVEIEEEDYNMSVTRNARIQPAAPGRLIVARTTRTKDRETNSCTAFQWNVARFAFEPAPAKPRECAR